MAENGTHIRRARITDIDAICEIERASFLEPWDAETFVTTLDWYHDFFFVAESGGRFAGFLAGAVDAADGGPYGHICNLAVVPDLRGRGIATKLVHRVERQFAIEGAAGVVLEVRPSNTPAQRFYRRLGYQQVFVIPGYYSNGEDAIVMMKEFLSY